DRLAGIDRLDKRDLVGARLDCVGDLVQEPASFVAGRLRPAGTERLHRGLRGAVNLGGTAARDLRDHRIVDWRQRFEGPPAARIRLAVDQMRNRALAEALQEALRARDRLVERPAHAAEACRSRMPLRSSRVSGSISWISTVSASGRALNTG